jgi:hypothetical protein
LRYRAGSTLSHLRSGASGVHYTSLEGTDDWSSEKRGWERSSFALQRKKRRVPGGAEIARGRQREGDEQRESDRESRIGHGVGSSHFIFAQTPATAPCLPRLRKVLPRLFQDSRSLCRPLHAAERMRSQPPPWGSRVSHRDPLLAQVKKKLQQVMSPGRIWIDFYKL